MLIINKINGVKNDDELIKKFIKPKAKKIFKLQKLANLRKKLSKSRYSLNFKIKKSRFSFLIFKNKMTFNCL